MLGVWQLNTRKELYRLSPLHNTIGNSVYKSWSSLTDKYHGQNLVNLSFAHILLIRVNEGLFYYILVKKAIKRSPINDILQGSKIHVSLPTLYEFLIGIDTFYLHETDMANNC